MRDNKWLYPVLILVITFSLLSFYVLFASFSGKNANLHHGCSEKVSQYLEHKDDDNHRITYCNNADRDRMHLYSDFLPIKQDAYIAFDYIGYPMQQGVSLYLEDAQGKHFKLHETDNSASQWQTIVMPIPHEAKGKIRVVAEDNATQSYGWIGLGSIKEIKSLEIFKAYTYLETFAYIILFALFIAATYSYFLKRNKPLMAYIKMSISLGLISFFTFFVYLYALKLGELLSWILFGITLWFLSQLNRERFREGLHLFLILTSMLSIILFLAYDHFDSLSLMQAVSADTWHQLPVDNWIPKIFANAILNEHIQSPLVGSWLSSDRPPLQVGWYLIFTVFNYSDLLYLVVSMGAQLLVIPFILLLVSHITQQKTYLFFLSFILFFNGFIFVHGLFVWPKLFSALYQGIAFYALYQLWTEDIKKLSMYLLFATASVLAFLAHGGSIFYLLGLGILLLFTVRNWQTLRYLSIAFVTALILYLPWVLYQKLIDPPGDRLVKRHLAAYYDITPRSALDVIVNYYQNIRLEDWLTLRWQHFETIYTSMYSELMQFFSMGVQSIRVSIFYSTDYGYLFFSSFFLLLYPLLRTKLKEKRIFVFLMMSSFFLYTVIWSLLIATETIVHQGAYFGWLSGFIAVTMLIYSFNYWVFVIMSLLNLGIFYYVYVNNLLFEKSIIGSVVVLMMVFLYVLNVKEWLYAKENKFLREE